METQTDGHTAEPLAVIAAMIAGFPLLGYLTAYVYELGQSRVFGYPSDLMRIDLSAALTAGVPSGSHSLVSGE